MKYILFLSLFSILVLSSCKTIEIPNCVTETNKDLQIRYGNYNTKDNVLIDGYTISSEAIIYRIFSLYDKKLNSQIGTISTDDYCKLINMINKEFIKTQTLNVQADTVRFVELIHPSQDTKLRAAWNPRYEAIGSKGFREIWDFIHYSMQK